MSATACAMLSKMRLLIVACCLMLNGEVGAQFYQYQLTDAQWKASDAISLEAWVQPAANASGGACLFDRWGEGAKEGVRLFLNDRQQLCWQTTSRKVAISEAALPTDRLSHVIAVFDARKTRADIYIDGQKVAYDTSGDNRWPVPRTDVALKIGCDLLGQKRFFGVITQAAVFDRALSDQQVLARYQGGTPNGLVAHWHLPERQQLEVKPTAGAGVLTAMAVVQPAKAGPGGDSTLWYNRPAAEWVEALPVGNGRLGAMVFGGVLEERLQLNEDTIWAGAPYDPANPAALKAYPKAQQLIFAGRKDDATELVSKSGMATPLRQASYSTLGNLFLRFPSQSPASNYYRALELDKAISTTRYTQDGVTYLREVFCTAVDNVVVCRVTADKPASVNFSISMATPQQSSQVAANKNRLVLTGTSNRHENYPGAIRFESIVEVQNQGGQLHAKDQQLSVIDADSVTLLVSCGTNFVNSKDLSGDPHERALLSLEAAAKLDYSQLLNRHVKDYQSLYRRVAIDLGQNEDHTLPTDERIERFRTSHDPSLAALFYQFGRYLLISSSRPGTQPANLQGIWNDSTSPPWGGKYTININTEMNYWPAESANLTECAEPLFQMVHDIAQTGQRTAKVMYGARGWVCHHNTDLWRATAPIDGPGFGMWPVGGAWLTTHLWEHYLYTHDQAFLSRAYPVFKGACEFYLDTLVEHPETGWLVTCPSISPEHGGLVAGPAMDMQILRDLFAFTAEAAEILGQDHEFRQQVLECRERLVPHQIGKYGQLQEWLEDKDREYDSHRHSSHLYALYPSAQINPETPNLFAAAVKSLEGRGDGGTGWALAWKVNLWARALDGDHAYRLLVNQLTPPMTEGKGGGTYPNLFDAHPPFQIDGNFGGVSGITELLMQSHRDAIDLLPALPTAWPTGSIQGLRARGGFEVDIDWQEGQLRRAVIRSKGGNQVTLRYQGKTVQYQLNQQGVASWDGLADHVLIDAADKP